MNALLGRPLLLFALFWVAGEVAGFYLLPELIWLAVLLLIPTGLLLLLVVRLHLSWFFLLIALAMPIGFEMASVLSHEPQPLGREGFAVLVGEVIGQPAAMEGRFSYFLRLRILEQGQGSVSREGLIYVQSWREPVPAENDLIRLEGKLGRPEGGFADYLRQKGSFWSFRADKSEILGSTLTPFGRVLRDAQESVEGAVERVVPPPQGTILAGILVGRVAALNAEATRPYQETGTAHILAASGINVTLLLAFLLLLGRFLRLPRLLPLILAIPMILFYATLCGWLPSVFRAAVMGLVGVLALLVRRERDFPTTMAAAVLLVLLIQPLALFAVDFQLSFLATLALFAFLPEMQGWLPRRFPAWLSGALFVTLAAQVGVMPLLATSFHLLSLVSPLANLLITPLVALLLPLGLVGAALNPVFPALGQSLLWLAGQGAWLLDQIVRGFAALPLSHLVVPNAPIWLEGIYWTGLALSLGLVLLFTNPRWRRRATFGLFTLFLLFLVWEASFTVLFPVRQLEVHFVDVGQGDAVLVRTPQGANILWDGGAGKACLRYLEKLGINRLDLVFLSHPHSDHLDGLASLLEKIPARLVLLGEPEESQVLNAFRGQLEAEGIPYRQVVEGISLQTGSLSLRILAPPAEGSEGWKTNDRSLVAQLSFGRTTLLLPGDVEEVGRENLERQPGLKSTVLKVPHHGSASGLDAVFLESVEPTWAVISVARENAFGHPALSTMTLLEEFGVATLLTSEHGTILLESDGETVTIRTEQ